MKIKALSALFFGLFAASAHAVDDVELWAHLNNLYSLIKTNSSQISEINKAIEVLKSNTVKHHIGDRYHGGIIFFIDETGEHGLIASLRDTKEQGIQWRNGTSGNKVTNARGDGVGAGETNTRIIIAQQTIDNQKGDFAALQASNFKLSSDGITPCKTPISGDTVCYGGWYLPSAYELTLIHHNLHESRLSSFAPEFYWSSTESDVGNAWLINFSTGEITANSKSSTLGRVRPISQF